MLASVRWHGYRGLVGLALAASILAACASSGASPTPGASPSGVVVPTSTVGDVTPAPTPTPGGPVCAVEDRYYEDGSTLGDWTRSQHSPVFSACPGAAGINAAVGAMLDEVIGEFGTNASGLDPSEWPATITITYSIAYSTPSLLSLRMVFEEDLHGAHPGTLYYNLNFRVADGSQISLANLFTDTSAGLNALSTRSRAMLMGALGADADPDMVVAGTTPTLENFEQAWAFDSIGLEITFQQYQVAPYVAGAPVIVIPWPDLASVIAPGGPAGEFLS